MCQVKRRVYKTCIIIIGPNVARSTTPNCCCYNTGHHRVSIYMYLDLYSAVVVLGQKYYLYIVYAGSDIKGFQEVNGRCHWVIMGWC